MNCRQAGRAPAAGRWSTCCRWKQGERINAMLPVREFYRRTASSSWRPPPAPSKKTAGRFLAPALERHHRGRPARRRPTDRCRHHRWQPGIMLFTSAGKAIRFRNRTCARWAVRLRCARRQARQRKQRVISLIIGDDGDVMTVTAIRTVSASARRSWTVPGVKGRGGQGVIALPWSQRLQRP